MVFPDKEALSQAAAARLVDVVTTVLGENERCTVALAGGSTPRRLYELLAETYRTGLPWERLYLFWGDDRYVPRDHAASNYRMTHEALLQHVPIPSTHIFPIPTEQASAEAAADAYETTLRRFFGTAAPAFDLTLLGLGEDGHTASLFPENTPHLVPARENATRWVDAVVAPSRYDIRSRITLTFPALNASDRVFFLAAGASKHEALHAVLHDPHTTLPAAFVRAHKELRWFVDDAAMEPR
jgi:6-phosphogluconolactonase